MPIKKLHKLILKAFIGPFLAAFSVSLFILVLQFLARFQNDIFGKGFSPWVIAQIFGYAAIGLSTAALALGTLLASLMAMGRLGENYELAALKASGISLFKTMRPLMVAAATIGLFAFWLQFYAIPWSNLKFWSLMWDVQQAKPSFALKPGVFNNMVDGYTMRIEGRKPDGSMLYGMRIHDTRSTNRGTHTILADSATLFLNDSLYYMELTLYNGQQYQAMDAETRNSTLPFATAAFDTLLYRVDMASFAFSRTDEKLFARHQRMLTIGELGSRADSLRYLAASGRNSNSAQLARYFEVDTLNNRIVLPKPGVAPLSSAELIAKLADNLPEADSASKAAHAAGTFTPGDSLQIMLRALADARSYKAGLMGLEQRYQAARRIWQEHAYEWHTRWVMPLATIIFLFIGAPLGAVIRKGGMGMPVVVSIGFFIIYYVLLTQGRKLAYELVLHPMLGAWLPLTVLVPIAVYIAYQSAVDAPLTDMGAWQSLGRRFTTGLQRLVPPALRGEGPRQLKQP